MRNMFVPEKPVISSGSSLPDQVLNRRFSVRINMVKFWTAFMEMSRLR